MNKGRRCDARCHNAEGPRCQCWCNGFFHGKTGEVNRQVREEAARFLEGHGGKVGDVYIDQRRMEL